MSGLLPLLCLNIWPLCSIVSDIVNIINTIISILGNHRLVLVTMEAAVLWWIRIVRLLRLNKPMIRGGRSVGQLIHPSISVSGKFHAVGWSLRRRLRGGQLVPGAGVGCLAGGHGGRHRGGHGGWVHGGNHFGLSWEAGGMLRITLVAVLRLTASHPKHVGPRRILSDIIEYLRVFYWGAGWICG